MSNAESQFPDMPGISTELALRQLGGNHALLKRLMLKFVVNHQGTKEEIVAALAQNDKEQAHRLAHTLKGVAGTIGALAVVDRAGQVISALKKGEDISALLEEMDNVLQSAIVSLAKLN